MIKLTDEIIDKKINQLFDYIQMILKDNNKTLSKKSAIIEYGYLIGIVSTFRTFDLITDKEQSNLLLLIDSIRIKYEF